MCEALNKLIVANPMRHPPVLDVRSGRVMRIWPDRNWKSLVRVALLGALLLATGAFTAVLLSGRRSPPAAIGVLKEFLQARMFENFAHRELAKDPKTLESDSAYLPVLLAEMDIAEACLKSWQKTGTLPVSSEGRPGNAAPPTDPWGRPYRVRLLSRDFLIVQSTGPTGQDRIPPEALSEPQRFFQHGPKLFGDNLVVGLQLPQRNHAGL